MLIDPWGSTGLPHCPAQLLEGNKASKCLLIFILQHSGDLQVELLLGAVIRGEMLTSVGACCEPDTAPGASWNGEPAGSCDSSFAALLLVVPCSRN